jgi:transketolase
MTELSPAKARTYSRLGQRGAIFGIVVPENAELNPNLTVVTADLATLSGLDRFRKKYPEQFYNVGIAEQNMMGIASGLASEGFLPVVTTYATFLSMRSCEQIRHYLGYMKQKVILIGSGAGLIQAYSGNTHYAIEDIAILRSIPTMTVLSPADAGEAIKAFEAALDYPSSVYIRLTGGLNCPIVYNEDYAFSIGKAMTLREGTDLVLFATGVMVSSALQVAALLSERGIDAKIINLHTI